MKRTHRHLEVVVCTQVDYMLPEGKAAVAQASQIIVPGIRRLMDLTPQNCSGVLFLNNYFTEHEYLKSEFAVVRPPHCIVPGLGDYESPGVQNVFSSFLLSPRGLNVARCYKKTRSVWERDMWDNQAKVSTSRGAVAHAEAFGQYVGELAENGVSNVTVWGVDTDWDVASTVDGFLVRGFKVKLLWDLCRADSGNNVSLVHTRFSEAIRAGQLEIAKYGDELQTSKRKPL